MISKDMQKAIELIQKNIQDKKVLAPQYDAETHVAELTHNEYYRNLLYIRDIIKRACDDYMGNVLGATNVDLFMLTTSVSSPMGPGSDSEPLPIKFGDHSAYLTDSSQFGFEPLLMNGFQKVYCYLPSMRGEDPDARHLNQFYHCEAEISGDLEDMMTVVEDFTKYLAATVLSSDKLLRNASVNHEASVDALKGLVEADSLERITFDDACKLLVDNGHADCVNTTDHGSDINSAGEQLLLELLGSKKPVWITHFDRDRVPFYQKPDPSNNAKVLCADLVFPSLIEGGFGGEIIGAGQRQDTVSEMFESLERQDLSSDPYEWYINLRNNPAYTTTSGFGMGIERFIAWALCLSSIRDAIIYPREKNVLAKP